MSHHYLYFIGMTHGIFLSLGLWLKNGKAGKYLALLGLVVSYELFVEYRIAVSGFSANVIVYNLREAVGALYGPFLFLYVCTVTDSITGFGLRVIKYFLPAMLFISTGYAVRWYGFTGAGDASETIIQSYFCHVKSAMIVGYIILSLIQLFRYHHKIVDYFSNTGKVSFTWLTTLITLVLIIVLMGEIGNLIQPYYHRMSEYLIIIHFILIAAAIYIVSYITFLKPDVYNLVHRMNENSFGNDSHFSENNSEPVKYAKSSIPETDKQRYLYQLISLMDREELFSDPDLTIGQVAEKMDLSINVLSQVINSMMGLNFFTFVSNYRILCAEKYLTEGPDDVNILSIGFKSGFNSKSAFYSAFKKKHGLSPLEFRKRHQLMNQEKVV